MSAHISARAKDSDQYRMALQLGFDVLAGAQTARTMPSQVSRSAVEREEAVRAYWMTMMLESVSTMGLPSRLASTLPGITATVRLPCSESVWATSLPEMSSLATSQAQYSSTFSLCVILAVQELGMVHDFCTSSARVLDLPAWQSEAQRLDERLTNWREEFVAAVFRLINSERDYLPMGEMEPLITLANCLLNM